MYTTHIVGRAHIIFAVSCDRWNLTLFETHLGGGFLECVPVQGVATMSFNHSQAIITSLSLSSVAHVDPENVCHTLCESALSLSRLLLILIKMFRYISYNKGLHACSQPAF